MVSGSYPIPILFFFFFRLYTAILSLYRLEIPATITGFRLIPSREDNVLFA